MVYGVEGCEPASDGCVAVGGVGEAEGATSGVYDKADQTAFYLLAGLGFEWLARFASTHGKAGSGLDCEAGTLVGAEWDDGNLAVGHFDCI